MSHFQTIYINTFALVLTTIICIIHFLMYVHFPISICVYVNSHPSLHKSVIQACSAPLIFHTINPLNAELNPICHLLALLRAHHILHVSRIRVKHKFTAITSCHKYTDACTEHRRSVKDTLQCTF